MKLQSSKADPVDPEVKRSAAEIASHNDGDEQWMVIHGKVYNVQSFLKFHPGGEAVMREYIGRDGTEAFMKDHAWVDAHALLAKCQVGVLDD